MFLGSLNQPNEDDYNTGGQDRMKHNTIVNGRNNCIGILPFCGQYLVGPAQLSCLGLLQRTETVFTCTSYMLG